MSMSTPACAAQPQELPALTLTGPIAVSRSPEELSEKKAVKLIPPPNIGTKITSWSEVVLNRNGGR